ncbi:MAG: acetoacetate decarboxylase family protein [Synergistes jonesii]|uniref:acetoacetate decarboxylase family protein n=1 Tax=Synergistes jonesii TaxID=2754 RepID=UPI002A754F9D|nr:acetoacetate decarboxylase family protein [Synergistes jonesii]MDY2983969.1 acetoacetate decarboxylase family protein [Synergistes jonesii]
MSAFVIKKGYNNPVQAPLVPLNVVPYYNKNSMTVYAICEVPEEIVKEHLAPTPFEYVSNRCMIYVNDFKESKELPYMDSAIIFEVRYKNITGGLYMYEWEDNDVAIATGRMWGYPKKYADIKLEKNGKIVHGTTVRKGIPLIDIEADLSCLADAPKKLQITPHLNLLTIPNPDGQSILMQKVTLRDNSSTCKILSNISCKVNIALKSSDNDPMGDFAPLKVLGGVILLRILLQLKKMVGQKL